MATASFTDAIAKIFFPNHLIQPTIKVKDSASVGELRSGYLVGWNVRGFNACIATIVSHVSLETLEAELTSLTTSRSRTFVYMNTICVVPPTVLGVCIVQATHVQSASSSPTNSRRTSFDPEGTHADASDESIDMVAVQRRRQTASLWLTLEMSADTLPICRSVYCCGYRYQNVATEIILYRPPNPRQLQYVSMEPLQLDHLSQTSQWRSFADLGDAENTGTAKQHATPTPGDMGSSGGVSPVFRPRPLHHAASAPNLLTVAATMAAVGKSVPSSGTASPVVSPILGRPKGSISNGSHSSLNSMEPKRGFVAPRLARKVASHLRTTLAQNTRANIDELECVLQQMNSAHQLESTLRHHLLPRSPFVLPVTELMNRSQWIWSNLVRPWILHPLVLLLFGFRVLVEMVLLVLHLKIGDIPLKHFSTTAQQVDLRLQQACVWPMHWRLYRQRDLRHTPATRAQYISFYNSMWLVANDIIIGVSIGSYLMENADSVGAFVSHQLKTQTIDAFKSMIEWLMGWPAGLKLNANLDEFLGDLFLWLLSIWTLFLVPLLPLLPVLIQAVGFAGLFGATMILSLCVDLLYLSTAHLYLFYLVAARLYHWQLNVILSLFHLFRGKKRNVLRNRLDSSDYDLDQLLLGTILFTVLAFLFPTVAVYYLLFSSSRLALVLMQAFLEAYLAVLNHFPLFPLMLRFKDPFRLPGGLGFKVVHEVSTMKRLYSSQWKKVWDRFVHPASVTRRRRVSSLRNSNTTTYLCMMYLPLPMSNILYPYLCLAKRMAGHYLSWSFIRALITGEIMRPIPRSEMMPVAPDQRPSLVETWLMIKIHFARETE